MPTKPRLKGGPSYEFVVRGAPQSTMRTLRQQVIRAVRDSVERGLDSRDAPRPEIEVSTLRRAPEQRP